MHFGVTPPAPGTSGAAAIDGTSVTARPTDAFDSLALRTRVDETGIPPALAGCNWVIDDLRVS
ncbi:hypothetical protein AMIS_59580 [Actinoplanes missouriensis 431]|uniref:Uncharacterized protein n=1 Tax=Actinoplanes missouriensis (strain ATCC 14538 / DSM 43046 / CBS 188.64 / JCM 3121 / NBRC 102363 / NCIMB 12654 / NRRL B-3342 / UNCC 431) TaxID=512565 RepID=I0HDU1_ACTM4|nr:hypothetical protein [Actinoplanes missouriensis]BAL91178.1 hypothetical protein AMIS_59580 [Actinoplanes missouriensis 431]